MSKIFSVCQFLCHGKKDMDAHVFFFANEMDADTLKQNNQRNRCFVTLAADSGDISARF